MNTNNTTTVDINEFDTWDLSQLPAGNQVSNFMKAPDETFLNTPQTTDNQAVLPDIVDETLPPIEDANAALNALTENADVQQNLEAEVEKQVRKGKETFVEFIRENIESGDYINYDDHQEGQDLQEYLSKLSVEDLKNLHKENLARIRKEESSKGPEEYIQSLDPKIVKAIYYSQMGQDPTPYIQAQYQLDNIRNVDLEQETVQEHVVKAHLTNTQFGTPEQIDAEIQIIKDRGHLEDKAKQFHPHLVRLDEQRVQHLEQQAAYEEQQRAVQYQQYTQGLLEALKPAELAGIKLDKKTQETLYYGLTELQYPDRAGNPTNLLGSILDRVQFTEPNYQKLARITLYAMDPDAYDEKIRQQGANVNTQQVVRQLKTEQSRHLAPTETINNDRKQNTIPRRNAMFSRPKV